MQIKTRVFFNHFPSTAIIVCLILTFRERKKLVTPGKTVAFPTAEVGIPLLIIPQRPQPQLEQKPSTEKTKEIVKIKLDKHNRIKKEIRER